MVSTNVFWKWWVGSFVVATTLILLIISGIVLFGGFSGHLFWMLFVVPVIFAFLMWSNRLIVQPEWNHIYTWKGKKMEPLVPGIYYLFTSLGFLTEVAEVPMNNQMLFIYSGLRAWVSEQTRNMYIYGTDSNVEPGTGAALGLEYKVEIKCVDPTKLVYNQPDSFSYIAGVIELEISKYVHRRKSERVIDLFQTRKWDEKLLPIIGPGILTHVGVQLISFVAGDIILNPESEISRTNSEIAERNLQTKLIS